LSSSEVNNGYFATKKYKEMIFEEKSIFEIDIEIWIRKLRNV
jgi:hypothetical protein